ncbi:MAG TPA: hypothetical protein ENO16_03620, partial [Chromatiales bacterium]|nr:hypothetical protein [Chromatiales bacterium]
MRARPRDGAIAPQRQLGSTVNRISATAALLLTLAAGTLTFGFGYQYQAGVLQTEASLLAQRLREAA